MGENQKQKLLLGRNCEETIVREDKDSVNINGSSKDRALKITALHNDIITKLQISLGKAICIGQLLFEQKKSLKHGEFTPWINDNLPFSPRTARNYTRLFENKDLLKTENVSDLSDAYNALRKLSWSGSEKIKSEDNKTSFMTIVIDAARRDIIQDAVDEAKELLNIESQSRALEYICYEWQQSSSEPNKLLPIETAKRLFEETYSVKVTIKNLEDINNHQG